MLEPEVALVFSPDRWVEDLHRHCVDHGGARIRCMVMDPEVALDEEYGVLVVSHRWPGLTRGLVEALHARGRRVLGIVDPSEPAAAQHLATLHVDAVIGADVSMPELVAAIIELAPDARASAATDAFGLTARRPPAPGSAGAVGDAHRGGPIVVGGPAGAGRTEVAIELARRLAAGGAPTVLVDADDVAPAIAPRLGFPIEPNLRTAVDSVEYGLGSLDATLHPLDRHGLSVLTGVPHVASWSQIRPGEVLDVVRALVDGHEHVVIDVAASLEDLPVSGRGRFAVARTLVEEAGTLVGVGAGTPVGVVRLLGWAAEAQALRAGPAHLVIDRAPADAFRRAEIAAEVERTFPAASLTFAPFDRRVERAGWEGTLSAPGPFTKAIARVAAAIESGAVAAVPARARRLRNARRTRRDVAAVA